ncbi:hypothetical protein Pcinc_012022 [Petrolisthes cinctipes]|uniref:Uncharacterized protein n=1 Tax=Petrolisthes cinctipes TaxID=88211 RepID=A0AAE1KRX1_PETCI|nr:hypothetical protein Pcinc_012022 [Petrolisthes cinctipes]
MNPDTLRIGDSGMGGGPWNMLGTGDQEVLRGVNPGAGGSGLLKTNKSHGNKSGKKKLRKGRHGKQMRRYKTQEPGRQQQGGGEYRLKSRPNKDWSQVDQGAANVKKIMRQGVKKGKPTQNHRTVVRHGGQGLV